MRKIEKLYCLLIRRVFPYSTIDPVQINSCSHRDKDRSITRLQKVPVINSCMYTITLSVSFMQWLDKQMNRIHNTQKKDLFLTTSTLVANTAHSILVANTAHSMLVAIILLILFISFIQSSFGLSVGKHSPKRTSRQLGSASKLFFKN